MPEDDPLVCLKLMIEICRLNSVDAPVNHLWSVELLSSLWRTVMEEHGFDTREGSGGDHGFDMEGGSGEDGDTKFTRQMGSH